jgi:hypothetical protein
MTPRQIFLFLNHIAGHEDVEIRWALSDVETACQNYVIPGTTESFIGDSNEDGIDSVVNSQINSTSKDGIIAMQSRRSIIEKIIEPIVEFATASDENMTRFRKEVLEFSRTFDIVAHSSLSQQQQSLNTLTASVSNRKRREEDLNGPDDDAAKSKRAKEGN